MKNRSEYTENLLNDHISGFHRYDLRGPARLTFVSRNFCEMTGYGEEELLSDTDDLWAAKIHPNDRRRYEEALRRLAEGEKTVTIQYRARRKDGGFCFLSDTLSAGTDENGAPAAYSVLSDITPLRDETAELRFFDETATGGFLRYTCEEKPKITYMNESLRRMLRFSADTAGFDDFELYRDNIYLLIPPEDRGGFARFLEKIVEKDAPAAGEMNFLRCDGTRGRLFGWVTKCVNDQGEEEFQSVLLDVTESYNERKERRTKQYRKALADVYDKVFEYDFVNRTVKYIYGSDSDTFGKIRNIPMDLEKATEQWLRSAVAPEDREKVHAFFRERILGAPAADGRPPQIRFGLLADNGSTRAYRGSFLWISSAVSFFCCRRVSGAENAAVLRDENLSLRHINENMQELVMQFTDGIVAFKVEKGNVRPLYASDNLCDFFGYIREEWLSLAREEHSIESFIAKSGVAPNDIEQLLCDGEAEFVYIDGTSGLPRRIKAICSRNSDDPDAPCYVLLSHMEEEESGKRGVEEERIYIRTFGYFDVFVEGSPIAFRNKKSKELFALLVDRRGGFVSSDEAISFLWEDEAVNSVTLARYRKVALRLKNILEEYGIADIVESVDGKRRIVTEKVRCDLYDYLSQKDEFAQLFKGSYLTNYSWGEMTLGELLNG